MAASIYLTSAEGRSGKSAVALGVIDALGASATEDPKIGGKPVAHFSHAESPTYLGR